MTDARPRPEAAPDADADVDDHPPAGKPPKSPPSTLRNIVEWVAVLGGALVIALVIRTFLFTTFWIPSASMEPTLIGRADRHDRIIVNRLSYKLHDVHRGDIIVFEKPPGESATTEDGRPIKDLIKRVIGLPGETISGDGTHVLINGKRLNEPYLAKGVITSGIEEYKIPPNHYWVMGDNRTNSKDSRYFQAIDDDLIVGRAFIRVWPVSAFGLL